MNTNQRDLIVTRTLRWGPLALAGALALLGGLTLWSTVQAQPRAAENIAAQVAEREQQADHAEREFRERLDAVRTIASGLDAQRIADDEVLTGELTQQLLGDRQAAQMEFAAHEVSEDAVRAALDAGAQHRGEMESFDVIPTSTDGQSYGYVATFSVDGSPALLSFTTAPHGVLTSYTLTWAPTA